MIAKFGEFGVIEEYFWLGLKESEPFVEHGRVGLVKYRIYDVAKKAINVSSTSILHFS